MGLFHSSLVKLTLDHVDELKHMDNRPTAFTSYTVIKRVTTETGGKTGLQLGLNVVKCVAASLNYSNVNAERQTD